MDEFDRLRAITARLRSDEGCPWDRRQTHESLKPGCIEEAAEVIGGINILTETGRPENLKEELGDLLFQIVLQSQLAEEEGLFTIEDVVRGISDKMIRRHPHVFGDMKGAPPEAIHEKWAAIKKQEKAGREWEKDYLPAAFDEAEDLIGKARERKGIRAEKKI